MKWQTSLKVTASYVQEQLLDWKATGELSIMLSPVLSAVFPVAVR